MTNTPDNDLDPIETQEWLDALASVVLNEGEARAHFLIQRLLRETPQYGINLGKSTLHSAYCNTIPREDQPHYPGDLKLEKKIENINRWNAIAMVLRARKKVGGVGGHLSSYASISTIYEVGQNHFFRATSKDQLGDLVYFQGHSSEGNYARAYLEGRLTENNLNHFRQEVGGEGLSSYPHPWLMPSFWQFATVSLGLGAMQGIYQARFMKYLENRKLLPASDRKVWIFCGDGEMDEPESTAGLSMAARENLDNLIYVVNCNLQRLDGLVRSNTKIIQELEGTFRGAGWNVIKVIWDSHWDDLFAKDKKGLLLKRLTECVDGDLQTAYVLGAAYFREFLAKDNPELVELLASVTDSDLENFYRGGHDPIKIHAAYAAAIKHKDHPTAILVQTVKGFGLGKAGAEGRNIAHNQLEMTEEELTAFCKRFELELSQKQIAELTFYRPAKDSPEIQYLLEKRKQLNGFVPSRLHFSAPLSVPELAAFDAVLQGTGERTMSTTMVLGRILNILLKDKTLSSRIVPIFSDEVRTFGLEALFRQIGIYSHVGQLYTPEDKEQLLYYRESQDGQVLEEGITEAGSLCSWIAAATAYSTHHRPMVPFFTFYSMFGFQRVGDLIWAAADMRARGFLIGATAGRTTLEGEGLQHQDGQSLIMASMVPSCRAYDPAFGYEMAVIVQHGLQEMYHEEKDVFYYITAMNEKYPQPAMPEHAVSGIIKGMYLLQEGGAAKLKVQLLGSGAILREVIAASELLKKDFAIVADVWSVTSFSELRREALNVQRENSFSTDKKPALSYVQACLNEREGPVIAATDYVRLYPDLVRPFINKPFTVLGTDGYGRSDTRQALRHFFEVDRYYIAAMAVQALAEMGLLASSEVTKALKKYNIDPNKPNPAIV